MGVRLGTAETLPSRRKGERRGVRVRHVELEAKHCRREHFALRIRLERQCPTAVERAVQEKIERLEIRELESLDGSRDDVAEMLLDALEREVLRQDRIPFWFERDDANVGRIAFVARASVGDVE